jgi:hypothetical protein
MRVSVSGHLFDFNACVHPEFESILIENNFTLYSDPAVFNQIVQYINYEFIDYTNIDLRKLHYDLTRYKIPKALEELNNHIETNYPELSYLVNPDDYIIEVEALQKDIIKKSEEGLLELSTDDSICQTPITKANVHSMKQKLTALDLKATEENIATIIPSLLMYVILTIYKLLGLHYNQDTLKLKIEILCKKSTKIIDLIRYIGAKNLELLTNLMSMIAVDATTQQR